MNMRFLYLVSLATLSALLFDSCAVLRGSGDSSMLFGRHGVDADMRGRRGSGDMGGERWADESNAGWQQYQWHSDEEMRQLQAQADSLMSMKEEGARRVANTSDVPQLCLDIVATAREYIGCKYKSGAMGPDRFDCSGFTSYVFRMVGLSLGRSSRDQFLMGTPVDDTADLRPGDLVFWGGTNLRRKEIGHVGIVTEVDTETGNFRFIHAAKTGIQIDRSEMPFYEARYRGARRIVTE